MCFCLAGDSPPLEMMKRFLELGPWNFRRFHVCLQLFRRPVKNKKDKESRFGEFGFISRDQGNIQSPKLFVLETLGLCDIAGELFRSSGHVSAANSGNIS